MHGYGLSDMSRPKTLEVPTAFTPGPVRLDAFRAAGFQRGASRLKETLWLLVRSVVFLWSPFPFYRLKRCLLRLFGARVGRGVVIKPGCKITFPWKLVLGDHCWLGEDAFLLNLDSIEIGPHVCVSQRAFLCTGNHDYRDQAFRLETAPIKVERGAWIAVCSFVGPGVRVGENAVLCAGGVATKDMEANMVYAGNPARVIKERWCAGEREARLD